MYDGEYIPSDSKTVTIQKNGSFSKNKVTPASTTSYNSGGYTGSLKLTSTSYNTRQTEIYTTWIKYSTSPNIGCSFSNHLSYYADQGYTNPTYSGAKSAEWVSDTEGPREYKHSSGTVYPYRRRYRDYFMYTQFQYVATYSGTVTKPASDTRVYRYRGTVYKPDTRTYRTDYTAHYEGVVVKPEVDTRLWEQNYSGTVYKSGYDDLYKYNIVIEYFEKPE